VLIQLLSPEQAVTAQIDARAEFLNLAALRGFDVLPSTADRWWPATKGAHDSSDQKRHQE
jgi:hypothetical protein